MQSVSNKWKATHNQSLLNESFVEISFDVSDPNAQEDATPSDNGGTYFSSSVVITDDIEDYPDLSELMSQLTQYTTLEQNLWVLNGQRRIPDENTALYWGYVSDILSDDSCEFSGKIPTITLTFSKEFIDLIPGITITWSTDYGEYATDFIVRAYNNDTIVAEKEILGNYSVKSLVSMDIAGYNRIVIYIKKWCLPHHRVRLEHIIMGINKVYTKSDLFSYSHKQSVSPISTSLPKNEIRFSLDNKEGQYNPLNETGMAKYLMERQKIKTRYGLKLNDNTIEWIKGGTFYLSEWYAKQNGLTADFTARDSLELLTAHSKDNHNKIKERSLWDIAVAVFNAANETKDLVEWHVDTSLGNIYTTAVLPDDTLANCLQLIANAGECVLYQDRDGVVRIEPLKDEETDYSITPFNSYSKPELTLSKPLKQVDVKVYTYTTTSGGFMDSATVTDTVSVIVGTTGETIVVDNPLITDVERAESVGNWMANYLKRRKTLNSSWRADVRLDALDIVTNKDTYNTNKMLMTDVEFKYNGAFRGTGEGKVM